MAQRVDLAKDPYLRLLLYGQPGSRKTRTAGTAALDERTAPVLWLDVAGNPMSMRSYDALPDIVALESLADLNAPFDFLVKGQKPDHPFCRTFKLNPPYKTVVIDSITEIQRYAFGLATGNMGRGPGEMPIRTERQHFNAVLSQMIQMARVFYQLPLHVIMTALERQSIDANERTRTTTLLLGQADEQVRAYATIVGRLSDMTQLEPREAKALTQKYGVTDAAVAWFASRNYIEAKDQYGALPAIMPEPTISKMLDLIYGT